LEFSEKEIAIIKAAEKNCKSVKIKRIILLVGLCAIVIAFSFGKVSEQILLYAAFGAPIFALLATQVGPAPKYEQLSSLLASKLNDQQNT
jgi:hypothetical protein